jgi:hypothetical protein
MNARKTTFFFVTAVVASAIVMTTGLRSQADGRDSDDHPVLQGSFLATVNESTPRVSKALFTFTRDGGLIETNFTPSLSSPFGAVAISHGAWVRTGRSQFALTFLFLGQVPGDPNSTYVRTKVQEQITLDEEQNSYTGNARITLYDPKGNVIGTATGTVEATRIVAEPISE